MGLFRLFFISLFIVWTNIAFAGYECNSGADCAKKGDIEQSACDIFESNFGIKPDNRDIRTVKSSDLPDFDVLTGGFPCQSFSIVAQNPKRLGVKDEKGMLFF